jgi:hypothetical protein
MADPQNLMLLSSGKPRWVAQASLQNRFSIQKVNLLIVIRVSCLKSTLNSEALHTNTI